MQEQHAADGGLRADHVDKSAMLAGSLREACNRVGRRRIDDRDRRKIDHVGFRVLADASERGANARCRAEEECTGRRGRRRYRGRGERRVVGLPTRPFDIGDRKMKEDERAPILQNLQGPGRASMKIATFNINKSSSRLPQPARMARRAAARRRLPAGAEDRPTRSFPPRPFARPATARSGTARRRGTASRSSPGAPSRS